jgi:putative oxidoreductase
MSTAIDPRSAPYAAVLLHVTLGTLFIAHLYWKIALLNGGLPHWWAGLTSNGYPWFVPYYVLSAEFVGALCLIPGLYARWAALYATPMMLGAAQFWAVRKGFYFTGAGCELPLLWSVLLIIQALLGDGAWALKASVRPRSISDAPPGSR